MKPEEAIEDIRKCIQPSVGGKSLQMAIQALEKQVPKPIKYATRCPTCDEIWYGDGDGYCNNCGQKLEDASYRKEAKG